MNFKGYLFRKVKDVVQMPTRDNFGNVLPYVEKDKESYIIFGKIVKGENAVSDPNAYLTKYRMSDSGDLVYAKPIKSDGYSTTNMMYAEDGSIYLMRDGYFYKAKSKR